MPARLPTVGSQLSVAGVHLRVHIPSCFNEWAIESHSDLATKGICDTASQYKRTELRLPDGHGSRILITAVVI